MDDVTYSYCLRNLYSVHLQPAKLIQWGCSKMIRIVQMSTLDCRGLSIVNCIPVLHTGSAHFLCVIYVFLIITPIFTRRPNFYPCTVLYFKFLCFFPFKKKLISTMPYFCSSYNIDPLNCIWNHVIMITLTCYYICYHDNILSYFFLTNFTHCIELLW
jgi:hypothetical protein